MNVIHNEFQVLFSSSKASTPRQISPPSQWQAILDEVDCDEINRTVTDEEITTTLQSMKPYKAPGPNGLHAGFFLRFWPTVGELVKKEVR